MPFEGRGPSCPHSSQQEGARNLGSGRGGQRPAELPPPQSQPSLEPALLTLDLLVDHQGEVIHLQDVRELAQRVRQADLEEKRCSVRAGAAATLQPGRSRSAAAPGGAVCPAVQ